MTKVQARRELERIFTEMLREHPLMDRFELMRLTLQALERFTPDLLEGARK